MGEKTTDSVPAGDVELGIEAASNGELHVEPKPIPQRLNELSRVVVDAIYRVHRALGPGLLESVYEACLLHELRKRALMVEQQVVLPVHYDGVRLD